MIADPSLKDRVALVVGPELRAIEETIAVQIASSVSLIREMGACITRASGTRLRAILLLLAARLAGYRGPRTIRLGCVVELLHAATLIHDDVVDRTHLRQGRPSAGTRWGVDAWILMGDHLYSKSLATMLEDGDVRVLETLARATVALTEAQVLRLERMRIGGPLREEDRLTITAQKTGALTSACCRVGALLGRADPRQLEGLTRYGLHIGIALQLDKSRRLLGRSDGIECACERALSHAQSAKEALRPFKDCGDKRILMAIADMVVECLIPPPGPRCTGTEPEAWCSSSRQ